MKGKNLLAMAVLGGLSAAVSSWGKRHADRFARKAWYRVLRKPPQTPPDWVFGAVWPVLYGLGACSAYRVWKKRDQPGARPALALWAAQLVSSGAWTPLFFGLRRARLALADHALTIAALAAYTACARKVDRPAAALMAPQLGWLGFAFTVNAGVVSRNPKLLAG